MSEVSKSIWIDAKPEIVFRYFTDSDKMARWCGLRAELDPAPKGIYRLDMGEAGVMQGRFVRVEAPKFLSFEVDSPSGDDAPPSVIEVSITAEAGGSRVDIRHTGLAEPFDKIARHGWDHHLARLSVAATGGSPSRDSLCAREMQTLI